MKSKKTSQWPRHHVFPSEYEHLKRSIFIKRLAVESIGIANFKAFKEKQNFKSKPLTLLVGPNSAGKSSLIHSLALLNELFLKGIDRDVAKTQLGGDAIDLGGFANYVHSKNYKDGITIDFNLRLVRDESEYYKSLKTEAHFSLSLNFGAPVNDYGELAGPLPGLKSLELREAGNLIFRLVEDGIVMRIENFNLLDNNFLSTLIRERFKVMGNDSQRSGVDQWNAAIYKRIFKADNLNQLDYFEPEFYDLLSSMINFAFEKHTLAIDIGDQLSRPLVPEALHRNLRESISGANGIADIGDLIKEIERFFNQRQAMGDETSKMAFEDETKDIYLGVCRRAGAVFEWFLGEMVESIETHLAELTYLGPLRKLPARDFVADNDVSDVVSGEFAWSVLAKDQHLRDQVNKWLGSEKFMKTPYELDVKYFGELERLRGDSIEGFKAVLNQAGLRDLDIPDDFGGIGEWLKEIQQETEVSDQEEYHRNKKNKDYWQAEDFENEEENHDDSEPPWMQETVQEMLENIPSSKSDADKKYLVLKDKRNGATVTHRDVGVGISQVLPVLTTLFASSKATIAIEQPELHLHPALQAELADVCIQSVRENKNSLLLETHSEHLILRIMRRIREGTLSHEEVSVIFIQPEKKGSTLKYLRIDKDGDFIDNWPDGFFAERRKELF
ncbi:DUF3696 domain-containing protein [Gammaproteobacteria bacterium]|nr:DUF3696 domain-containing protein [Gammaproteobacteria bacterium]